MNQYSDVIVIGGGAAGMISAAVAAERQKHVVLLEKADRNGRKIFASGNGRCNMLNNREKRYYGDSLFAESVLQRCPRNQIASFFNRYGLFLKEESEGRVYPITNQSSSVVSVLKNAMMINGVTEHLSSHVVAVEKKNDLFSVHTSSGSDYYSEHLIITCGGSVQPKLGGSSDGYRFLTGFGHKLVPVSPSLVAVTTDTKSISGLSGIRIRCGVRLLTNNHVVHQEEGEVLFTDYGVSGICIMQCGRFVSASGSVIELDLLKDIFPDRQYLREEINRRRTLFRSCSPIWLLNGILPEKISFAVMKQAGLALHGETAGETDDASIDRIMDTAYAYTIQVTGTRGFDYAQVTAGGIDCSEFNSTTMESNIIQGLFAAGEVLNVDGDCGGYNLMFAFASGMIAGQNV